MSLFQILLLSPVVFSIKKEGRIRKGQIKKKRQIHFYVEFNKFDFENESRQRMSMPIKSKKRL